MGPALWLGACGGSPEDAPKRPNLVLVSIDSLRADHLGCYGYGPDTSPTIDRLAAEGVRFSTAISTTSWTLPAHAALFTGLSDVGHRVRRNGMLLAPEHLTLAEVLRDAGYHTAGFFGGPYLHPTFGLAQGFDVYQSCMTGLPDDLPEQSVRSEARRGGESASHQDITGPRTREEVRSWLEGAPEEPLFLFIHLWDVHYDYIPPREYVERFDPGYSGDLDAGNLMRNTAVTRSMEAPDLAHLLALYDGEIRFTDDVLGQILADLRQGGVLEDAILVVTADHGEEFFEHGGKGHQRTLFDEVVHVPLVVHAPGRIQAGRVVDPQVRLIDLMPTLLSLAGVPLPRDVEGRDLSPLLLGETLAPAPALLDLAEGPQKLRGRRTQTEKLIVSSSGGVGFFDLTADPAEAHPLPLADPRQKQASAALRREVQRARTFAVKTPGGGRTDPVDPDVQKRLEALGYTEDSSR